jgi:hypothetical protein
VSGDGGSVATCSSEGIKVGTGIVLRQCAVAHLAGARTGRTDLVGPHVVVSRNVQGGRLLPDCRLCPGRPLRGGGHEGGQAAGTRTFCALLGLECTLL